MTRNHSPRTGLTRKLRGSASWMLLPAIAMVAPLGVALDAARSPAMAFTYGGAYTGVVALNPGTPDVLFSGGYVVVGGGGPAVSGDASVHWTISNAESISNNDSSAAAVTLTSPSYFYNQSGGTVSNPGGNALELGNASNISPNPETVNNAGLIAGYTGFGLKSGVYLTSGGAVTNSGTIIGAIGITVRNAPGTIINTGSIVGGGNGLYLPNGGTVYNSGTGSYIYGFHGITGSYLTITNQGTVLSNGTYGVLASGASTLVNSGTISANGTGVYLGGGSIQNSGTIIGANHDGIYLSGGGTVVNSNSISGYDHGIYLKNGGTVTNGSSLNNSASITGYQAGIEAAAIATVNNFGTISAQGNNTTYLLAGVSLDAGGVVHNYAGGIILGYKYGVKLGDTGTVNNAGSIYGEQIGVALSTASTLTNTGSVTGAHYGVMAGLNAVIINGGTANPGAQILGGEAGIRSDDTGVTVINYGSIWGAGQAAVELRYGGAIANHAGGTISGGYLFIAAPGVFLLNGGSISNDGVITGTGKGIVATNAAGTLVNSGTVTGGSNALAVYFNDGGTVTNLAGGTIGGYYGLGIFGASGTVTNSGTILSTAANSNAVQISGGTVANKAGGVLDGDGIGILMTDTGSITNAGRIIGHTSIGILISSGAGTVVNQAGGYIYGHDRAVQLNDGGSLSNSGTIISGQDRGVGSYADVILTNSGLIQGDTTGVRLSSADGDTVTNSGTIIGQTFNGLSLYSGGALNNQAGGLIQGGYYGVNLTGSGTVNNTGTILGDVAGIRITSSGSTVNNSGLIQATGPGILFEYNIGQITNTGAIRSSQSVGALLQAGGTITNGSTGNHGAVLSGYLGGVFSFGDLKLANYGTITATNPASGYGVEAFGHGVVTNAAGATITGYTAIALSDRSTVTNSGVIAGKYAGLEIGGGTVVNNAGATLSGFTGVYSNSHALTLTNFGTIIGAGTLGCGCHISSMAVYATGPAGRLILGAGYKFVGGVEFPNNSTLEWASGTGTLSNLAAVGTGFTKLENDAGATLTNASPAAIALAVTNRGTIAPTAALNLTGNFIQTASGVFKTTLSDAGPSAINVTGAAAVTGGVQVSVVSVPANVTAGKYAILTATGGVTGSFSAVSGGTLLLSPSLSYDANDVYASFNQLPVAQPGETPNELAVAGAIDKARAADPTGFASVIDALDTLTTQDQLSSVLNNLTGEAQADLSGLGLTQMFSFIAAFEQHSQSTLTAEQPDDPWITGYFQSGQLNGAAAQSVHEGVAGSVIGADHVFAPGLRGGVMAGLGTEHANIGGGTIAKINYEELAFTADYTDGALFADGLLGYAHSYGGTRRAIALPGIAATAIGHPSADQVMGSLEAGYAVPLDAHFSLAPFAGLDMASDSQDGFTETGAGALNLSIASHTTTNLRSIIGTRLNGVHVMVGGADLTTELKLGWAHGFYGSQIAKASFASVAGTGFTVSGAPLPRDAGVMGLGLSAAISDSAQIHLNYDGEFAGNATSHTISFGISVDW